MKMRREFNNPELIKDAENLGIKITLNSSEPGVFANINGERYRINIDDLFSECDDDLYYHEDFKLDDFSITRDSNQHKVEIIKEEKNFYKNELVEAA